MNFERHYEEQTAYITLGGETPIANSMPINKCFLGKKFQKILKNEGLTVNCFMNVCYDKSQSFTEGTIMKWKLREEEIDVYLIESKKLFIKGKHIWAYCVGIVE
ncbi:hypothetical protein EDF81_0089 [Enterobacter sp. BIGb0383]|uniref:hypothetical protein n=1 Tax=unclassified Enterobacter TaxID=2608935 RepID=UPI000F48F2DF|nr:MULTISPECIES: hypothetical protein [unclassified Enterobacter]ROP61618.1 hypothetical protein EDF81_0089 [Enterobacter sp. BIGb0383]ROS11779.1 hypothetical protein EC848_0089 [Enterobacter sp. BIGb0359]